MMPEASTSSETGGVAGGAEALLSEINEDTLRMRADRLDRVLNGHVAPVLGLHAALVGACLLVWAHAPVTPLVWGAGALILAALGLPLAPGARRRGGLVGAAVVFASAWTVTASVSAVAGAAVLTGLFASMAGIIVARRITSREFLFAPIYLAVLIEISQHRPDHWLLFGPILVIACLAALFDKSARMTAGPLIGFAVLLIRDWGLTIGAVIGCAIATIALVVYALRATRTSNSDLVNFVVEGVACAVLIAILQLFLGGHPAPFAWPVSIAAFFLLIAVIRRRPPNRTTVAWFALALMATVWSLGKGQTFLSSLEDWRSSLTASLLTLSAAGALRLIGQRLSTAFVANVGAFACLPIAALGAVQVTGSVGPALAAGMATTTAALVISAAIYAPVSEREPTPWNRGFISDQSVVLLGRLLMSLRAWLTKIPLAGGVLSLIGTGIVSLRYLKRGGRIPRFADVEMLSAAGLMSIAAKAFIVAETLGAADMSVASNRNTSTFIGALVFGAAALFLYGFGLILRETLFAFAALAFTLVPFVDYVSRNHTPDWTVLGELAIALGFVQILCAALWSRWRGRLQDDAARASTVATARPGSPPALNAAPVSP